MNPFDNSPKLDPITGMPQEQHTSQGDAFPNEKNWHDITGFLTRLEVVPTYTPKGLFDQLVTVTNGGATMSSTVVYVYETIKKTWVKIAPQQLRTEVFNSGGTWNRPDGVGKVFVRMLGAGGGGGEAAAGAGLGVQGGGGGAGGYVEAEIEVDADVVVSVGTGGPGGTGDGPSSGGIGGDTSFVGVTTVTAGGGGGGINGGAGGAGGAGGTNTNGDLDITGRAGKPRTTVLPSLGGDGADTPFGSGGPGGSGAGSTGSGKGSGGGGGGTASADGGSGANGMAIIQWIE